MNSSGDSLSLPQAVNTAFGPFPEGAHRANLYVYSDTGRIDWYALVPQSFLDGRYFTMGRGRECNIVLDDGAVSTRHAYVTVEDGQLVFRDLQSTNGSSVNGTSTRHAVLEHGDVIRVGATDIRFLYSYRESPVHLVLAFTGGVNAGKSVATFGASTSIGRTNCAINLPGAEIGGQHARIDAFGAELMFVVNLDRDRETLLNGAPVVGISPASAGDRVTIGGHEMVLQLADDQALVDAVPQGDGTLLIMAPGGRSSGLAPVVDSILETVDADATVLDLGPSIAGHFFSPTGPAAQTAARVDEAQTYDRLPVHQTAPPAPAPQGSAPQPRKTSALGTWIMLAIAALLAGFVGAAALIDVERTATLQGTFYATDRTPVVVQRRARVEQLYFVAGDPVAAGDVLANVVDLDFQAKLDLLQSRIAALREAAPVAATTDRQARPAPIRLSRALAAAKTELKAAKTVAKATLNAFQRREVGFEALDAARARELAARRAVENANSRLEAARRVRPSRPDAPDDSARRAALAQLQTEVVALETKARRAILAPKAGVLLDTEHPPKVGSILRAQQPIYDIASTQQLQLKIVVPPEHKALLEAGGAVEVTLRGSPARPFQARLNPQQASTDAEGRLLVTARISNRRGELRRHQQAEVRLEMPPVSALSWIWGWLL